MAVVERLPVLHHSADYIFISFRIVGPIVVSLKMAFCSCTLYTLEGVSSIANLLLMYYYVLLLMKKLNKTDTPILFSVVCSLFPKAIFFTFI